MEWPISPACTFADSTTLSYVDDCPLVDNFLMDFMDDSKCVPGVDLLPPLTITETRTPAELLKEINREHRARLSHALALLSNRYLESFKKPRRGNETYQELKQEIEDGILIFNSI